jgi:hypothetical protein
MEAAVFFFKHTRRHIPQDRSHNIHHHYMPPLPVHLHRPQPNKAAESRLHFCHNLFIPVCCHENVNPSANCCYQLQRLTLGERKHIQFFQCILITG